MTEPGAAAWGLCLTADGTPTLVHPGHGEACHSRSGAWLEARARYADACRLRERALDAGDLGRRGVFELLDVGTGIGLNLAAALCALEGSGVALSALTLERERGVIERALELAGSMPAAVEPWHAALRQALGAALGDPERAARDGVAIAGVGAGAGTAAAGRLRLLLGDARETLRADPRPRARFDAVFLDPFSPRADPSLWEAGFLASLARRMAPGSWLSTYTASLAVRARLAAAGLKVGPGPRVGAKREGTLASPDRDPGRFDARTTRRLARRAAAERGGGHFPSAAAGGGGPLT